MNLRLSLVSSGYDPISRRWTLDIQDHEDKIIGTTWVADPFTALEEENLAWYLEKFAIDDPFARGRATVVTKSLSSYKHALAAAIEPLLLQTLHGVKLNSLETIILGIRDFEKEERSINALHWELLEDQQSWKELTIPVLFFRLVKTTANLPLNPNVPSNPQSFYNILLISARPGLKNDLPYRLISKPIWDLIQSDSKLRQRIKIHFVRPGTWTALKKTLSDGKFGFGFFSLVHFDTHGVVNEQGRAKLKFSSADLIEPKSELVDAARIADILVRSGVKIVVLNACNTAKVSNSTESNLARIFNIRGISNVVSMSFALMSHSAKIFMTEFYERYFLVGDDIQRAVSSGRKQLREQLSKPGRFAVDVSMDDSCVPVLYQNHDKDLIWDLESTPFETTAQDLQGLAIGDGQRNAHTTLFSGIIGRDVDLLLIEAACTASNAINIIGAPGVGKTAAINYVEEWWMSSDFVERSFRFDFTNDQDLWTDSTIYRKIMDQLGRELSDLDSCTSFVHTSRFLIVVDNFAPDAMQLLGLPWKPSAVEMQEMSDFIRRFRRRDNKCILILLSRTRQSLIEDLSVREIILKPLSTEDTTIVARQMLAKIAPTLKLDDVSGRNLERLIAFHKSNLLFLELFVTLLTNRTPQSLLLDLQLGLPNDCCARLESYMAAGDSGGSRYPFAEGVAGSDLVVFFRALCDFLKSQRPRCYWMLLSLAIFQERFVHSPALWLFRLYNGGLIGNVDRKRPGPGNLRPGEIETYDPNAQREFFATNKDWLEDFKYLLHVLSLFGLGKKTDDPPPGYMTYYDIHPLLPYLIRHEIQLRPPSSGNDLMGQLRVIFWEYYEIIISQYTTEGKAILYGGVDALFKERANISNAFRLSIQQPKFGFRQMRVYFALYWVRFDTFPRAEIRQWLQILTEILDRFENWVAGQEVTHDPRSQFVQAAVFEQAMLVALNRGSLFYLTKDTELTPLNTQRAQALFQSFSEVQPPNGNTWAILYAIETTGVASQRMPIVMKREKFKELIGRPLPNGTTEVVKSLVFDKTKFVATLGYIFAQVASEGPESQADIVSTLSQASGSLKELQKFIAKGGQSTRTISDLIESVKQMSLPGNEKDIFDSFAPIFKVMSAISPHNDIFTSDIAIIRSTLLKETNIAEGERDQLQRAVGVGHAKHDIAQESSAEEGLFALAIQRSDYEAAMLHHKRSLQLGQQNPSVMYTAVTLQNGEGIRNYQVGMMLLAAADSAPGPNDETNFARAFQAKEHLDVARHLLSRDPVSRVELYTTLMALAEWEKKYAARPGVGMAYLLQAASLKYQEESPFSRATTDNGRVIEQVCREWLCSLDPGIFVTQLAQVMSQQPPHMMMSQLLSVPSTVLLFLEQCAAFLPETTEGEVMSEPVAVLEEAQMLALAPESRRESLIFWTMNSFGGWEVDRATVVAVTKALGAEHPPTLTSVRNLVSVLQYQGKYEVVSNLTSALQNQGKREVAEEVNRRALQGYKKALVSERPSTLTSVSNPASALRAQGKYNEEMYRQMLEKRQKFLGNEHADTLTTINNLAVVLQNQGENKQAEEMYQQALKGREKVLGKEHIHTLTTMNDLAIVLKLQNKNEQAKEMYQQALEGREKVLGKEHADTLSTMNNLAVALQSQGKYEQAEEMYQQALRGREKVLGKEHVSTLTTMNNLAIVLKLQNRNEQAERMYQKALKGREKVLGKEHADTLSTMNNLAVALQSQGKNEQAEKIYWQALRGREKVLGKDHAATLTSMSNLAHCIASKGNIEAVKLLLDQGAEIEAKDNNRWTLLHSAVYNKQVGVIKLLLDRGADIEAKSNDNLTPLHSAASMGDIEVIKLLLDRGVDIEAKDKDNRTPLFYAACDGHVEVVKLLLDQGAGIKAKDNNYWTTLHFTALIGNMEVTKLLLDKGVDIEAKNNNDWTPLHSAAHDGHIEVVKLLLDRGADIKAKDKENWIPLHFAASKGNVEVAKLLLDRGADIEAKDNDQWTPLYCAALKGNVEVVKLLLDQGADIEAKDNDQWTPLYCAASKGNVEVIRLLVDRGAEIEAKDNDHWTPLQKVLNPEHPDTLTSMSHLASALSSQGKYTEAEQVHQQTLELRRKVLGPEHLDTLTSMSELGEALSNQGKYTEAKQVHQQTLELRRKVLGPEHLDTLASMSRLALLQCENKGNATEDPLSEG